MVDTHCAIDAFLQERVLLTKKPSSHRKVFHVVLRTSSKLNYLPGDVLGVYPKNNSQVVNNILSIQGIDSSTLVFDECAQRSMSIYEWLISRADLYKLSSYFCRNYKLLTTDDFGNKNSLKTILLNNQIINSADDFLKICLTLMPRFYSIASCCDVDDEVHLIVGLVVIDEKLGEYGVCSQYLCLDLDVEAKCTVFIKESKHFNISHVLHNKPIVMIGTGTGIAPYLSFIKYRMRANSIGENHLFFGERQQESDFYFREFLEEAKNNNKLYLTTAFSRDSTIKEYIQDKIYACKEELLRLINKDAYIFVCGSKLLGKEIDATIIKILAENSDIDTARKTLRQLRAENKYMRDVY